MSRKRIWLPDELTEDIILTEIPSDGSCDDFGLSDNEPESSTTSSISMPIFIDDNTKVILEDDPLLSEINILPESKQISNEKNRDSLLYVDQDVPSTSSPFQTSELLPLFSDVNIVIQNSPVQVPTVPDTHPQNTQVPKPHDLQMENDRAANDNEDADDELEETPLVFRIPKKTTFPWKLSHPKVEKIPFLEDTTNTFENITTPTDMFLNFFPTELIDEMVFQTNLYATQKDNGVCRNPTNVKEMKNFIAVNIIMGIKKLPSYRDYWSSDPTLRDNFISNVMPVNRFSWLLSHLHFADNNNMLPRDSPNYDKLFKIRPVLNKLSETFAVRYKPTKLQAIDESMIKFKGRSSLKQYMPMKPIKRGYKLWTRADERGFITHFEVYTGKVTGVVEQNLGPRVVKRLCKPLEEKGYEVYIDNFFTSVSLFDHLQRKKVYACGTILPTRKFTPKKFKADGDMARGESQYKSSTTGLSCVKWKDNKGVLFLSNHHDPTETTVTQRKEKDGSRVTLPCPKVVKEYNANMGFVDKADHLKSCYSINRKSRRWYMRIFWHLIDVTVVNSFIAYGVNSPGKKESLKNFRISVANGLLSKSTKDKKKAKINANKYKMNVPVEKRFKENVHLPQRSTWKRCNFCSTKQKQVRSYWECSECKVSLCLTDKKNCFFEFHTN